MTLPIGIPFNLPLYVRAHTVDFDGSHLRHLLINVLMEDRGVAAGNARVQCISLNHDYCSLHEPAPLGCNVPTRAGVQVFVPELVFAVPIYVVLARTDVDGEPFVQIVRICLAVNSDDSVPRVRIRARTHTFPGVRWDLANGSPFEVVNAPEAGEGVADVDYAHDEGGRAASFSPEY
ncbi:hypothetical protein VTO73DRAFT_7158 [Trametes versicolor]